MKRDYAEYLINKTRDDYNLIAEDFSRTRQRIWEEVSFLFSDIKTGEDVLDLGCGNGRYYEIIKSKGADYTGTDNSEKLIKLSQEKYKKAKFLVEDACNLSFPDNSFDKIYSIAVLHRIPSKKFRLQFLTEAKRVLKKEGKLIITVWSLPINRYNKKNIFLLLKYTLLKIIGGSKLDFKDVLEPWGKKTEKYYHWFSKRELRKLVEKAGFKIEKIGSVENKTGNRKNLYVVARPYS